jgi:hypothetical protein
MSLPVYIPVDCGFHDQIEAAIVRKTKGDVTFVDEMNEIQHLNDVSVLDWVNENKEEFMLMSNGLKIRLDRIHHFFGNDILSGYCVK